MPPGSALAALVILTLAAPAAQAACDKRFDGLWANEVLANGQCAAATFANDSRKGQTGTGSWTTADSSCDYQTSAKIFEVEYDNKLYRNLSTKMIDANTCELTFGKARVPVDRYNVWKPVSNRAQVTLENRRTVRLCFENQGHQFGQCVFLDYIRKW